MSVNYFELGASLYSPATRTDLLTIFNNFRMTSKSIVICTEDAVSLSDLPLALTNLSKALSEFDAKIANNTIRLVRPRNPEVLGEILKMKGIENIDGFVLPKATIESLSLYREKLKQYKGNHRFSLMPTLETKEAISPDSLSKIREELDLFKSDISCLRIGGNDLMNILGIKRMPGNTIYETPVRNIIDNIILQFRPYGYEISGVVFDYIDDRTTLCRELEQDLNYGFFAKTAIHPEQAPLIENAFREYLELNEEKALGVMKATRAVYQEDGQMMELTCHAKWAQRTALLSQGMNKSIAAQSC